MDLDFAGLAVAGLDGVDYARADFGGDGEAVDEDEDWPREVELEKGLRRGEFDDAALLRGVGRGLVEAVVAAAAQLGEAVFESVGEREGKATADLKIFLWWIFRWVWGDSRDGGGGWLEGLEVDFRAGDGEERIGAGAGREGEEGGDDLVDGVVADDAAAVEAGDVPQRA